MYGRNMAYAQELGRRKFMSANAQARETLGIPAAYGAPVMLPPTNRLGGALSLATSALSIASSVYSLGGLGNTTGPFSKIKWLGGGG